MLVSGRVGDLLSQKGAHHYDGICQLSPFKKASFEKIAVGRIAPNSAPKMRSFGGKMFEISEFIHVSVYSFWGGDLPLPTITDESSVHSQPRVFTGIYLNGGFKYFVFSPGDDPIFDKSAIFLTNGVGGINHQPVKRVFYIPKTPVCVLGCQNHHDPRWLVQEGPKLRNYEVRLIPPMGRRRWYFPW